MDRQSNANFALIVLLGLAGVSVNAAIVRGVPSCADWNQERQRGARPSYFNAMWLVGYLSGAAVHSGIDILRNTDSESIAVWMDRYCEANSLKNVANGGEVLINELALLAPAAPKTIVAPPVPVAIGQQSRASAAPAPVVGDGPHQESTAPVMPVPLNPAVETTLGISTHVESVATAQPTRTYLPKALLLTNALPLTNSKYQFKAEQYAKSNGCGGGVATINIRTATSETFTLSCSNGAALSIRCDPDCRDLQ